MQYLKTLFLLFTFTMSLLVMVQPSYALKSDNTKEMIINADRAEFYKQKSMSVFQGHVTFDQGTTHIEGDKAIIQTDSQNKVIRAEITGKLASYQTQPQINKPKFHAQADKITYQADKKQVTLQGHAKAWQQQESFSSPKIIYNLQSQSVISAGTQGRTTIVLQPTKKGVLANANT